MGTAKRAPQLLQQNHFSAPNTAIWITGDASRAGVDMGARSRGTASMRGATVNVRGTVEPRRL
eukprot:4958308-Prymnesium_polylepis.1